MFKLNFLYEFIPNKLTTESCFSPFQPHSSFGTLFSIGGENVTQAGGVVSTHTQIIHTGSIERVRGHRSVTPAKLGSLMIKN